MRTCLVYFAVMANASVQAGKIRLMRSPLDEMTGNIFRFTANTMMRMRPTQKFGTETPKNVKARTM